MNLITQRIRGMQDVLPGQSEKWSYIEKIMREEAELYGFKFIRTPVLEHTELFERSAGDTSDVVEKEMYTFLDKGGRSVSMRPEVTASVLRAVLENGLYNAVLPLKVMYFSPCYRYDKPQSGRLREFFQFGLEVFGGDSSALADAELITLTASVLNKLGIGSTKTEINTLGCPSCREEYKASLIKYFEENKSTLCSTCLDRLHRNPMRIVDCKSEICGEICKNAPVIMSFICKGCAEHFENLKQYLVAAEVEYIVNPRIVRGLDYYTKTVFEFVYENDDMKIVLCGGGRYDGLSKIMGGPELTAVGMAMGIERVLMVMGNQDVKFPEPNVTMLYIAPLGGEAKMLCMKLAKKLRKSSIKMEVDVVGRNIKAQMKYADRIGAKYVVVIGSAEMETGIAKLKNMETGEETDISLNENFVDEFQNIVHTRH